MNNDYSEILIEIHAQTLAFSELMQGDWIENTSTSFRPHQGQTNVVTCEVQLICTHTGFTYDGYGHCDDREQAAALAVLEAASKRFEVSGFGSASNDEDVLQAHQSVLGGCDSVTEALDMINIVSARTTPFNVCHDLTPRVH